MKKRRILKALASLRLAVFILLALAAVTAWGTFVEAKYDASAAQKIVYKSVWMYSVMGLLAVNLIAVMVDRWPWKAKHTAFVLAHVGILILMAGSWITQVAGLDGSLTLGVGEGSRHVVVGETDFTVYVSMESDVMKYTKYFDREVDFFLNPPTAKRPLTVNLPKGAIRVIDYLPYALRDQKWVETQDEKDGPAVRFQLQNPNVNVTEWLHQSALGREAVKDLGPARVVLTRGDFVNPADQNTIVLRPQGDKETLTYEIHSARDKSVKKGVARAGDAIETGWMGLTLRLLKFMPNAKESVSFQAVEAPTPLTTSAIKIDFNGVEEWLSLNSMLKLFGDNELFIVTYANRRIDLGFDLKLKKFNVGRYQGTMRAASYESLVELPDGRETLISMNEPLKMSGFTFYQASFQEDEKGQPVASILSVNDDPGRWIKYLGSFLIVLGSIHLFYFKRRAAKKAAAP